MSRYIKLKLDYLQRRKYSEKNYRKHCLRKVLGKKNKNVIKYNFRSYCFGNLSARSVSSQFTLSRWFFRKYANSGYMPGIRTAS